MALPERAETARSMWSGTITFGLVSVPVRLHPATRSSGGGLRMLAPDGTQLQRRYVCPAEGGEPLSSDDIVRGYEVDDGSFVVVSDEELESLSPDKSRDIELERFVDRDDLPVLFFERGYFLVPSGQARGYQLLAEVMEREGKAGIASFVMRGKHYQTAILADGGVLRAEILRAGDELRAPDEVPAPSVEADKKRVKQMRAAIQELAAEELAAEELEDDRERRLRALVEEKREAGEGVVETGEIEAPALGQVIDLMAELKRELGGDRAPTRRAPASDKTRADLEEASKDELYQQAKRLDIAGRSKMNKSQLLDALRARH